VGRAAARSPNAATELERCLRDVVRVGVVRCELPHPASADAAAMAPQASSNDLACMVFLSAGHTAGCDRVVPI
jgi:hypothetical protein